MPQGGPKQARQGLRVPPTREEWMCFPVIPDARPIAIACAFVQPALKLSRVYERRCLPPLPIIPEVYRSQLPHVLVLRSFARRR